MSQPTPHFVRPTKRCLADLGLGFPVLELPLHQVEDALVAKAQQILEEVGVGSAERIRAVKDRVWFKVKVSSSRGAVTELDRSVDHGPGVAEAGAWWWMGAAGKRQEGSCDDFYRSLTAEVTRAGRGTGSTSSGHLLPAEVDIRRLEAELAVQVTMRINSVVRKVIAASIKTGSVCAATFTGHRLAALVKARDGEAYLAVTAEGFIDVRLLAVILSSVPNVAQGDWLPEPQGAFGINPEPGQIIYSTMISAASQAEIMEEFSGDDLADF